MAPLSSRVSKILDEENGAKRFSYNQVGREMKNEKSDKKFYLVREDVLPEAMKKTLDVKEMLERGKAESIWDAVQQVDLSRSAYYKYKDTVFPFSTIQKENIISLFFISRIVQVRCQNCLALLLTQAAMC